MMVEPWGRRKSFGELSFSLGLSLSFHVAVAGLVLAFPHLWGGKLIKVPVVYEVSLIGPLQAQAEGPLSPTKASPAPSKAPPPPLQMSEELALPEKKAAKSAQPRMIEELALPAKKAVEPTPKAEVHPPVREVVPPVAPPLTKTQGPALGLASSPQASAPPSSVKGAELGFQGVEVEGDPHLSYYLALVRYKIELIWTDLPTIGLGSAGPVIVSLRILRSGQVRDITIEASSGNRLFDDVAIRAIRLALPLPPFPQLFKEESVPVKFRFMREVVRG